MSKPKTMMIDDVKYVREDSIKNADIDRWSEGFPFPETMALSNAS